jgi:uncharacterized membrane protein
LGVIFGVISILILITLSAITILFTRSIYMPQIDWDAVPEVDDEELIDFIYNKIVNETGCRLEKEMILMVLDYELDFLEQKGIAEAIEEQLEGD